MDEDEKEELKFIKESIKKLKPSITNNLRSPFAEGFRANLYNCIVDLIFFIENSEQTPFWRSKSLSDASMLCGLLEKSYY